MSSATLDRKTVGPKMVKVKLLTSRVVQTFLPTGAPGGLVPQQPGDVIEMSADEAERSIAAGHCREVKD